jgi:lipopolysaccharide/colanic/teichoic acid biosynthesis glycosyltransferase
MLFFALLIRRDGGPAFFGQPRIGQNGGVFKFWKLRTMRVDADEVLRRICAEDPAIAAEWEQFQKLKNDPRVTRIGRFLRATSLDEIPQIWNVFIGDMSLVGPRPMLEEQEAMYRAGGGGIGYFGMRPGITGPWQIDGRGTTKFLDRIGYDNHYYETVSLRADVSYIVRTVGVVFQRTGH